MARHIRSRLQRCAEAPNSGELPQDLRIFLGFGQRNELFLNVMPIGCFVMTHRDAFRVAVVDCSRSEQLHHDQVLGRASAKFETRCKLEIRGPLDHESLEWERAKGNIDADAAWRVDEEHSRPEGELCGVGYTRRVMGEESLDNGSFVPEAGEQSQVDFASITTS